MTGTLSCKVRHWAGRVVYEMRGGKEREFAFKGQFLKDHMQVLHIYTRSCCCTRVIVQINRWPSLPHSILYVWL